MVPYRGEIPGWVYALILAVVCLVLYVCSCGTTHTLPDLTPHRLWVEYSEGGRDAWGGNDKGATFQGNSDDWWASVGIGWDLVADPRQQSEWRRIEAEAAVRLQELAESAQEDRRALREAIEAQGRSEPVQGPTEAEGTEGVLLLIRRYPVELAILGAAVLIGGPFGLWLWSRYRRAANKEKSCPT